MLLPAVLAFVLAAPEEHAVQPYRWRAVPVDGVRALALPTRNTLGLVVTSEGGYVLRTLDRLDPIPMERVAGIAVSDYAPDLFVAVGHATAGGNLRFSVDGGASWRPCPNPPSLAGGHIVASSDGRTWVWSGENEARRTDDYGFTWTSCEGLDSGARIVADRTSSRRFYALTRGQLYVSDDGAKDFEESARGLPPNEDAQVIVPTPGRVGDLWLLTRQALYRATPGRAFVRVPGVTVPSALSFGLAKRETAAPNFVRPSMFMAARIEGREGLFRSDDEGVHWTLLGGAPSNADVAAIVGSPTRAGTVYVINRDGGLLQGTPRL